MPWGAVIAAGANLLGASMASGAAEDTANAQIYAADRAAENERAMFDITRKDYEPFRETGVSANALLKKYLGIDPTYTGSDSGALLKRFSGQDLESDPVYQSGLKFGLDEGTKAINNRAIARGMYDSGATLKELARYGADYGSTKANEAYNRYNTDWTNIYNRLAGVSGAGQTATNAVASARGDLSNNLSNLITGQGNARAAGIVGGANAWGGALGNIANTAQNYFTPKVPGYGGVDANSLSNFMMYG